MTSASVGTGVPVSKPGGVTGARRRAATPGRVMIADDSGTFRGLLAQWIEAEPDLELVARCTNGRAAVDRVAESDPDVIVLDVEMPVMDGLSALPLLRAACPNAHVLVVSALTKRNAEHSLKALELGASDCLPKPDAQNRHASLAEFQLELLRKIRGLVGTPRRFGLNVDTQPFALFPPRVVTIGSSTGGPEALSHLLRDLAPSLSQTPVLIAQHMPPLFTVALADRLARSSGLDVREAEGGEVLLGGCVYVAPGGRHMTVKHGVPPQVVVRDGPAVNFCRPSVDLLFESVADVFGSRSLSIILTGMGADGAEGAASIVRKGGSVIAQDMETSAAWGMPGSAANAGVCAAVLPLGEIAEVAAKLIKGEMRGAGL